MPLNTAVFKTRSLSAIVFAIIMLTCLLGNHWLFLLMVSIVHFGCWYEYLKLQQAIHACQFSRYEKIGMMMLGYSVLIAFTNPAFSVMNYPLASNLFLPLAVAGFFLLAYGVIVSKSLVNLRALAGALFGLIYISLSLTLFLLMRQKMIPAHSFTSSVGQTVLPLLLVASIWVNDTMAYIVGSIFGRTQLHPVSPKKTWEGTIGGAVLALIVAGAVGRFSLELHWQIAAGVALLAAIFGTLGDLFESYLKRRAGVKDSGKMMPGHGGFLDRFDSLLLATPAVWLFLELMM